MNRTGQRTTLRDVAEKAAVSPSVASRILNEDSSLTVRDDTRERVIRAAADLRYRPHAGARGVRAGTIGAIGLLIPDLTQPIYARIVRGAMAQANQRNVVVLVGEDLAEGPSRRDANLQVERMIQERRIDGLLMASARPRHPIVALLRQVEFPHVFLNRSVRGSQRNVTLDDAKASIAAVTHLIELGHTHLGHIAGPAQLDTSRRRELAFLDVLAARALPPGPVERSPFSSSGGFDAATVLMSRAPQTTAIYTSNFGQAVGALRALRVMNLAVPGDVSVITYDDVSIAEFLDPPLTTIRVPLESLGAVGVDQLLSQLDGHPLADVVVPSDAVVIARGSTAPPNHRRST